MARTTKKTKRVYTEEDINKFKEIVGTFSELQPKVKSEKAGSGLIVVVRENYDEFVKALKEKGYTMKDLVTYINEKGFPVSEFVLKKYINIVKKERETPESDGSQIEENKDGKSDISPVVAPKGKNLEKAPGAEKSKFTEDEAI